MEECKLNYIYILFGFHSFLISQLQHEEQKVAIHNSCWSFFIDVLSQHCFGLENIFPDHELVKYLLDSVFPLSSTKCSELVMHKFLQYHKEKSPQIQSIMVKMLLRYE